MTPYIEPEPIYTIGLTTVAIEILTLVRNCHQSRSQWFHDEVYAKPIVTGPNSTLTKSLIIMNHNGIKMEYQLSEKIPVADFVVGFVRMPNTF